MTTQRIFNRVWQWFIVEKHEPAAMAKNFQKKYGFSNVHLILREDEKGIDYFKDIPDEFLSNLQMAHDIAAPMTKEFHSDFERLLRNIAHKYSLNIPTS